jgi:hypothetical protein
MPLVVVLALGALISSFVAVALRTSLSGASAASAFVAEMRADELGRTAVDLVAYRIMSGGQEARRGGSFAASFGDCVVTVDYVSESARVDVNHAVPALIGAVFRTDGGDFDRLGGARPPLDCGTLEPNRCQRVGEGRSDACPAFSDRRAHG